jgi:hypothetical protein
MCIIQRMQSVCPLLRGLIARTVVSSDGPPLDGKLDNAVLAQLLFVGSTHGPLQDDSIATAAIPSFCSS